MADQRIERAFAAIQVAHTELHKTPVTPVTTACWTHIAIARQLLYEVIDSTPVPEKELAGRLLDGVEHNAYPEKPNG